MIKEMMCRVLAKTLGCTIEEHHQSAHDGGYWVWGPHAVYNTVPPNNRPDRIDPHPDHHCPSWTAVLARLHDYADDLAFHKLGIDSFTTVSIHAIAPPAMLRMWLDDPAKLDAMLVLADWFIDNGHQSLSDDIQEAIKTFRSGPCPE